MARLTSRQKVIPQSKGPDIESVHVSTTLKPKSDTKNGNNPDKPAVFSETTDSSENITSHEIPQVLTRIANNHMGFQGIKVYQRL